MTLNNNGSINENEEVASPENKTSHFKKNLPDNIMNADNTLWSLCTVVVDDCGLCDHPYIATIFSQKSVLACTDLSLGEH